jgi:NAD(P)-dependent dehydrogenase (short-subunit alcohol dehydrogenase family)
MSESNRSGSFSVSGRSAIVTGAGSGINYCFAKLLLKNNCNVVIADLALRPEAQKLIDDYTTQPRAVFVKTDVVMWDELNNMFDVAEKEFGGADIVRQLHHRPPPPLDSHN